MDNSKITSSALGLIFASLFLLCLVSPFFNATGHGIRYAWIVYSFWLVSVFFGNPNALKKTASELQSRKAESTFLLCWLIMVLHNAVLGRGYTSDLHFFTMISMAMVVFMLVFYTSQRDGTYELLLKFSIFVIGIEIIRSLPTLWTMPALARLLTGGEVSPADMVAAGYASVGQYGYYTGLAIVLPVIVTRSIASTGIMKVVLWLIASVIILAISISTFMGAILLMVIGICSLAFFHILYSHSKIKSIALYGVLVLLLAAVWSIKISNLEQGSYIEEKIVKQFSEIATSGIIEGDQTKRADLWKVSINTFLEHPFFGIGPTTNRDNPDLGIRVGAHSSWLDQLAEYGVLGFGFYVLFFGLAVKRVIKSFATENSFSNKICYLGQIVSCVLFIIGGIYNPVIVITEIFALFYIMGIR